MHVKVVNFKELSKEDKKRMDRLRPEKGEGTSKACTYDALDTTLLFA